MLTLCLFYRIHSDSGAQRRAPGPHLASEELSCGPPYAIGKAPISELAVKSSLQRDTPLVSQHLNDPNTKIPCESQFGFCHALAFN